MTTDVFRRIQEHNFGNSDVGRGGSWEMGEGTHLHDKIELRDQGNQRLNNKRKKKFGIHLIMR